MIDGIPNQPLYFYQKDITDWMNRSRMAFDIRIHWSWIFQRQIIGQVFLFAQ